MDFSSTAAFLTMLDETLNQLASRDLAPDLNFVRIVASKVDENKSMQKELLLLMRQVFGLAMIRTPMKDSAEIDNVTARLMTVYEMNSPMTSKSVRDRCLTYLNGVNEEILLDVRQTWPSHVERLRKEGHAHLTFGMLSEHSQDTQLQRADPRFGGLLPAQRTGHFAEALQHLGQVFIGGSRHGEL